eukprot:TRINITY_DN1030_c0_g2_i8.p1 TRINITY_DN1030_c0_g2~~TRINITY_DN1030_c0_g2_i8.p1  ORF type:complete len:635 (-),score=120.80 TRINITY_DN1030_c0_g2_i8:682-2586(-)
MIYDYDKFSSDDFMGCIVIEIDNPGHNLERWFTVAHDPYNSKGDVSGELLLRFEFAVNSEILSFIGKQNEPNAIEEFNRLIRLSTPAMQFRYDIGELYFEHLLGLAISDCEQQDWCEILVCELMKNNFYLVYDQDNHCTFTNPLFKDKPLVSICTDYLLAEVFKIIDETAGISLRDFPEVFDELLGKLDSASPKDRNKIMDMLCTALWHGTPLTEELEEKLLHVDEKILPNLAMYGLSPNRLCINNVPLIFWKIREDADDGDNLYHIYKFVSNGGDINVQDHEGRTLGFYLAQFRSQSIPHLIAAGWDLDIRDNNGNTFIMDLFRDKSKFDYAINMVEHYPHLLNCQNNKGQTLSHIMLENGDTTEKDYNSIRIMHPDFSLRDTEYNRSILQIFFTRSKYSSLIALAVPYVSREAIDHAESLSFGVALDDKNKAFLLDKRSGLYDAIVNKNMEELVSQLTENPWASTDGTIDGLDVAVVKNWPEGAMELVRSGNSITGFHIKHAASRGFSELLDKLMSNIRISKKMTPLLYDAFQNGHTETINVIFKHVEDKTWFEEAGEKRGMTVLHIAVVHGNRKTVHQLLQLGLNPNIMDSNGKTPLIYAVELGNAGMIKVLQKFNADLSIVFKILTLLTR